MTEAMGHGVNQRKAIQMTPEEVEAFIAERRPMTMCSIGPDGSIHAVAMWYGFVEGRPAFWTFGKSQKMMNLRSIQEYQERREQRMTNLQSSRGCQEHIR